MWKARRGRRWGLLLSWGLSLGLSLDLALTAGCAREGDENLGLSGLSEPAAGRVMDSKKLAKFDTLLEVVTQPYASGPLVRLLPHRLEVHTSWKIRPPPPPDKRAATHEAAPVALEEDALLESDGKGGLHVLHNNDHGYGSEAVVLGETLYIRMRYGPYVRRHVEGDEVARLSAAAADTGAALLEALAPWLEPSASTPVAAFGRPALRVTLRARSEPVRSRLLPGKNAGSQAVPKAWRQGLRVESLDGVAVLDQASGAVLGLRLAAVFHAPRAGEAKGGAASPQAPQVTVEVTHRSTVDALGQAVTLAAPKDAIDTPVRPRPLLDQRELLDGLVPRRP